MERVTFSPGEFAALFGKSQTWGYRQIYAGKVKAISEYGRILIPASEVERILASAGRYEGRATPPKTKAELQKLAPVLHSAWQNFLQKRRKTGAAGSNSPGSTAAAAIATGNEDSRKSAFGRLGRKR